MGAFIMFFRIILCFSAMALLNGCASTSPKNFVATAVESSYVLDEDVMYMALKANAFHPDIYNGLAKGRYVARFEDAKHTYYEGTGACVLPFKDRGGIAFSKDGSPPRLWVYIRDDSQYLQDSDSGALIVQLSKLEAGRIRIFNTVVSNELAAKLKRE